jgi:hypothetical protein
MYYEVKDFRTNEVLAVFLLFQEAAEDWIKEQWPNVLDRMNAAYVGLPKPL